MGMYDMICDEQVKCFGDDETDGYLTSFGIGDEVPYDTEYYQYPKDFNILLLSQQSNASLPTLIKIRDGNVHSHLLVKDSLDSDWNGVSCITKHGGELFINSVADAEEYDKNLTRYHELLEKFQKEKMPNTNKKWELFCGFGVATEEEKKKRRKMMKELQKAVDVENAEYAVYAEKLKNELLANFFEAH